MNHLTAEEKAKSLSAAKWAGVVGLAIYLLLPTRSFQAAVEGFAADHGAQGIATAILSGPIVTSIVAALVTFAFKAGWSLAVKVIKRWLPEFNPAPPVLESNAALTGETSGPGAEAHAEACVCDRLKAGDDAGLASAVATYKAITGNAGAVTGGG